MQEKLCNEHLILQYYQGKSGRMWSLPGSASRGTHQREPADEETTPTGQFFIDAVGDRWARFVNWCLPRLQVSKRSASKEDSS